MQDRSFYCYFFSLGERSWLEDNVKIINGFDPFKNFFLVSDKKCSHFAAWIFNNKYKI